MNCGILNYKHFGNIFYQGDFLHENIINRL